MRTSGNALVHLGSVFGFATSAYTMDFLPANFDEADEVEFCNDYYDSF